MTTNCHQRNNDNRGIGGEDLQTPRNLFIILLCLFCSDKNPDISKSSVVYMDAVMIKLVKAAVKADGLWLAGMVFLLPAAPPSSVNYFRNQAQSIKQWLLLHLGQVNTIRRLPVIGQGDILHHHHQSLLSMLTTSSPSNAATNNRTTSDSLSPWLSPKPPNMALSWLLSNHGKNAVKIQLKRKNVAENIASRLPKAQRRMIKIIVGECRNLVCSLLWQIRWLQCRLRWWL